MSLKNRNEISVMDIESHGTFTKVVGEMVGGSKIRIHWKVDEELKQIGVEYIDYGYAFEMPEHTADEGDIFIHVQYSNFSQNFEPVFVHLYELITNTEIEKIEFIKKQGEIC